MYVYLKIESYQRIKSPTPCFWFACRKLFGSGYPPPPRQLSVAYGAHVEVH